MEMACNQENENSNSCDKKTHDSDTHSPCKEECACCMVMQVVIMYNQNDVKLQPNHNQEQLPWIVDNYTHDFTHLIWHPPKTA